MVFTSISYSVDALIISETQDIPLLQGLAERSFLPTYLPFISEDQVMYMFASMYSADALQIQMAEKGHRFFIAYEGEQPLGFASIELNCAEPAWTKLHKLYVLPEAQGKAVGFNLLQRLEQIAAAAGQIVLFLNVNRYNRATDFYRRQGYEVYLEEDIDIGNGYFMNDYRMRKSLAAK